MQIDVKTDKLLPCHCGKKPDHYSIGYGRTPYYVNCVDCIPRTKYVGGCGGYEGHIIDWWNYHGRFAHRSIHLDTQSAPGAAYRDPNSETAKAIAEVKARRAA